MSGRRNLSKVFFGRFNQTAVETQYLNLEKSRFPLDLKVQIFREKEPKVAKQPQHYHQHHYYHHHHHHQHHHHHHHHHRHHHHLINKVIITIILNISLKEFFHHLIPARNYSNRCNSIHDALTWKNILIRTPHWLLQENSPFFSTHRNQSVVQRNVGFSQTNFYYFQSNT